MLSGCGEVWYRAWFGTKRPRVQIPTLRPEKKHPLSTGQRVFLFNEINPCGFVKCSPSVKYVFAM